MSAKRKLNASYMTGAGILAATVGMATGSLAVTAVTFAVVVSLHAYLGNIRR